MIDNIVKKTKYTQKSLKLNFPKLIFLLLQLITLSQIQITNSCKLNSPYYVKNFLGIDTNSFNIPCVYSGLIEIQSNIKVHFVVIKSRISSFILDESSKSLLIWLNEPGKSFFQVLLNSSSPFKLQTEESDQNTNEELKVFYDELFNINLKSDLLFIDYPGNVGYSTGIETFSLPEITAGFVSFIKKFNDANVIDLKKQEAFFMGYSWLTPYLANAINSDTELNLIMKITKVGLINTKTNYKFESDYKVDYLKGLGIITNKDVPEIHNLEHNCDYNKNNQKNYYLCLKLASYIETISGDINLDFTKSSIYSNHGHFIHYERLITKKLNEYSTKESLNVNKHNPFVSYNQITMEKAMNYNRNSNSSLEAIYKSKRDFHIYYLSGQYDLDNSGENYIDSLIPSLAKKSLGYFKVPIEIFKSLDAEYPASTNIIKGYIKQNSYFTYLLFKDAGKYIPTDDSITFTYFLNNFFLEKTQMIESITRNDNHNIQSIFSKTNAIGCPDDAYLIKENNPNNKDFEIDANKNKYSTISDNHNNHEKILEHGGGCRDYSTLCKVVSYCNSNGFCNDTTQGYCQCFTDYYGPDCFYKISDLNRFTKAIIQPRTISIFSPKTNMDFVISDNILFEIETDNPSIVISILEKEKHKDVHDFTKHVYFQRLLRKSTVIYLDKDKIDKLLIVVTNTDPQSNANVNFNLFNFNTKSSEFFGPGGLGFVVSLILFCIGIALYSSVSVLYKDFSLGIELSYSSLGEMINRSKRENFNKFNDDVDTFNAKSLSNDDESNVNTVNTQPETKYQRLDDILRSSIQNSNYNSSALLDREGKSNFNFKESKLEENSV